MPNLLSRHKILTGKGEGKRKVMKTLLSHMANASFSGISEASGEVQRR